MIARRKSAQSGDVERWSDPPLLVLSSLAGGEKHGYAMVTDIAETSGVHLGPGTLYGALARLEEQGLIAPLAAQGRRRPYRITAAGRRALEAQLTTIEVVARTGLSRLRTAGNAG
jgi:DNA-binding PadR family transcriptional regulator